MKLLIVQPWFSAKGHPAQSLINLASAIGKDERVDYLISFDKKSEVNDAFLDRLMSLGNISRFDVSSPSARINIILALVKIVRMQLGGQRYQHIFFFDGTPLHLGLVWLIFSWILRVERISVLHLWGPELVNTHLKRFIIQKFLSCSQVRLYLRTEELAQAWSKFFVGNIRYLPSLELPEDVDTCQTSKQVSAFNIQFPRVNFGVVGQIRLGKGLEWLIPLFKTNPSLGVLTVAGAFNSGKAQHDFFDLLSFENFINKYLTEEEMLEIAGKQDYLLMLYGDSWDPRMESAVLYLAARVNKPVITYCGGWTGRMVEKFGCGLIAGRSRDDAIRLLNCVPLPGSVEYKRLCDGVNNFKHAHSVNSLRSKVMQELGVFLSGALKSVDMGVNLIQQTNGRLTHGVPYYPLITVIVAVYNGARTLQQCIDSIAQQSYPAKELIVIDGASTDGTVGILKQNMEKISHWVSEPDRGIYDAWNKGLAQAKGEWICFLGADDYFWERQVLVQVSEQLVSLPEKIRVAYGQVMLLNNDGARQYPIGEPWEKIKERFKQFMCIPHPGAMHHRSLFELHGYFDDSFCIAGDYELLLRELKTEDAFFIPDVILVGMRQGGVSSNPTYSLASVWEIWRAQRKHGRKFPGRIWLMVLIRVYARLLLVKLLGERTATRLFNFRRKIMGLGKPIE